MTTTPRSDLLTTTEMYHLDQACQLVSRAFGGRHPYLVGTAGAGGAESYRDVDVRLMLDDGEFAAACPTRERWELLSLTIGAYLSERSGLKVDFQVQLASLANERFSRPRNPLGIQHPDGRPGRVFAGGGDGTPDWDGLRASEGLPGNSQAPDLDAIRASVARQQASGAEPSP